MSCPLCKWSKVCSKEAFQFIENISNYNVIFFTEEIRKNTLVLVGKSYSSLELRTLCNYVGYDSQNTLALIESHGWKHDDNYVFPTPIIEDIQENRSDFNAFKKLTDSISFLEN